MDAPVRGCALMAQVALGVGKHHWSSVKAYSLRHAQPLHGWTSQEELLIHADSPRMLLWGRGSSLQCTPTQCACQPATTMPCTGCDMEWPHLSSLPGGLVERPQRLRLCHSRASQLTWVPSGAYHRGCSKHCKLFIHHLGR